MTRAYQNADLAAHDRVLAKIPGAVGPISTTAIREVSLAFFSHIDP
jgi:hypothetical protein